MKMTKNRKTGQNQHFYLSIKQIITLEIVINSLSRKILEKCNGRILDFFGQSCDILKNSCFLVTQIYAPQHGGI